jgi:hypothetical protein
VKVREDRGDGSASITLCSRHLRAPGSGVEVRQQELIHRVIDGVSFQQNVANLDQCLV